MADSIEAARAGADLIACAVYPLALSLHRVAAESLASALAGMGLDTGVDVDRLWEASDLVDEHIGDEIVTPHAPRLAVRAAEYDLPTGLVAALDTHLRAHSAGDRLLETLEELQTIRRETGWPPLAAPIGQILASQALIHVLSARRYGTVVDEFRDLVQGHYGSPPAKVDPTVARAVTLLSDGVPLHEDPPSAEDVRQEAAGPGRERGGAGPDRALRRGGGSAAADDPCPRARARTSARRRSTSHASSGFASSFGSSRRAASPRSRSRTRGCGSPSSAPRSGPSSSVAAPLARPDERPSCRSFPAAAAGAIRVESPMVGVFYRSPEPGKPAFVEVGDVVVPGQTLCLLEAMKLFNELKADAAGRVTAIHAENGKPVEFGQLLFELEPIVAPPVL